MPESIAELVQLENIFDVMDIYLWLSYRFTDLYPHGDQIREAQAQLDELIQSGVEQITKLIKEATSTNNISESKQSYSRITSHIFFLIFVFNFFFSLNKIENRHLLKKIYRKMLISMTFLFQNKYKLL